MQKIENALNNSPRLLTRNAERDLLVPARSTDLTPLDFFLFHFVKDKEYSEQIQYLQHFKTRVTHSVRSIDSNVLSNVWSNVKIKLNCIVL